MRGIFADCKPQDSAYFGHHLPRVASCVAFSGKMLIWRAFWQTFPAPPEGGVALMRVPVNTDLLPEETAATNRLNPSIRNSGLRSAESIESRHRRACPGDPEI
jgi:hypothetical protein